VLLSSSLLVSKQTSLRDPVSYRRNTAILSTMSYSLRCIILRTMDWFNAESSALAGGKNVLSGAYEYSTDIESPAGRAGRTTVSG